MKGGVRMKRILVLLLLTIGFSISNAEIKEFSIVAVGNFKEEYRALPRVVSFINEYKNNNNAVIVVGKGNNGTNEPLINDIFSEFRVLAHYNFNFLGRREYLAKEYNRVGAEFSSINIPEVKEDFRYKIVEINGCKIALIGITDAYGAVEKEIFDYNKEIMKLLYKIEDESDIVVVISELRRNENLALIQKYKDISMIIETGAAKMDKSYSQIGEQYIVPGDKAEVIKFLYKWHGIKKEAKNRYNIKSVEITAVETVDNFEGYSANEGIINKIKKNEALMKRDGEEIYAYNDSTVSFLRMTTGDMGNFVENIAKKVRIHYGADIIILPAGAVKGKLEKGYVTHRDLKEFFKEERMVVFSISKADLDNLYKSGQLNRGNEKYLNFPGHNLIDEKAKYRVVSTENIFEYYKINVLSKEIKSIGLAAFAEGEVK